MAAHNAAMAASKTYKVKLREFDISKMDTKRIALMIGSTGSGKSTLLDEIKYVHRDIPLWKVFAGTTDVAESWRRQLPDSYITADLNLGELEGILDRQDERKHQYEGWPDVDLRTAIVVDDCGYEKQLFNSPVMRKWFMNGRHYNVFGLLAFQYCMDMPPHVRENTGYVFVYHTAAPRNQKRYYDNFFGGVGISWEVFQQIFNQACSNYGCLVLDNANRKSLKLEDKIFTYRARDPLVHPIPHVRLGCDWMWRYHAQHYLGAPGSAERRRAEGTSALDKASARAEGGSAVGPPMRKGVPHVQLETIRAGSPLTPPPLSPPPRPSFPPQQQLYQNQNQNQNQNQQLQSYHYQNQQQAYQNQNQNQNQQQAAPPMGLYYTPYSSSFPPTVGYPSFSAPPPPPPLAFQQQQQQQYQQYAPQEQYQNVFWEPVQYVQPQQPYQDYFQPGLPQQQDFSQQQQYQYAYPGQVGIVGG
jgi:energy-coupling factor transporter ATP-binding protein EcfA2